MKYTDTLSNQLKSKLKNQRKNHRLTIFQGNSFNLNLNNICNKIKMFKMDRWKNSAKTQRLTNTQSKIKPKQLENKLEQRIVLGVKIIRRILDQWKWQIKYSEKTSHCAVWRSNKSRFLKQKIN